ncbi:MAG: cysteine desulfurase-like protein [Armatimonadetes bacterium]|nr:cysteine desulfurase-like protein [Armatimonadota bacterium]
MVSSSVPSISEIRAQFPSLKQDFAFFENAGGSQVPKCVIDAISAYFTDTYVQLGAGYPASNKATEIVAAAHDFVNRMFGGEGIGTAVLGPSSTQLMAMLAECYCRYLKPGERIVVAENAHESNINPWMRMERLGYEVDVWKIDPKTQTLHIEDLDFLLKKPTRLLCFPHVSNLLGHVSDIASITKKAHEYGARVVVDAVAYAPHRPLDVAAWDVDFSFYSTYKVYGPHLAAMFGRKDALDELVGPNHFFVPRTEWPYKFELGGANHEGCAGLCALSEYIHFLNGSGGKGLATREEIVSAFTTMGQLELPLQKAIMDYLRTKDQIQIIGPATGGMERVPTISFVHKAKKSEEIAAQVQQHGIGVRHGHMYAYRLCEALGIEPNQGVVRTSLVHYNTMDEVERLIKALEEVL